MSPLGKIHSGKTGTADLPLHGGKAPRWLFNRMVKLTGSIVELIVSEFSPTYLLEKLSDPYWFQALGCVVGFDWHSSGVTTTVCGALKEATSRIGPDIGFFVTGGKGAISRQTPLEIENVCDRIGLDADPLTYASRISAKIDSSAVQDGFNIYHHCFFFTKDGDWCVIQQGMNAEVRQARRYHWLGKMVKDFTCEPHSAVCCDVTTPTLNLVSSESTSARAVCTEIASLRPEKSISLIEQAVCGVDHLTMPQRHFIKATDINPQRLKKILLETYKVQPGNFEELLALRGVGAKTLRALALVSDLVFGEPPSYRDPARFSFAHGGKDGHPYPVDRRTYDETIRVVRRAIEHARMGRREKLQALRTLSKFFEFG